MAKVKSSKVWIWQSIKAISTDLSAKTASERQRFFKVILGLSSYQSGEMSLFGGKNEAENRFNRKRIGFFVGASFFGYLSGRENLDYRRVKGVKNKNEISRVLDIVGLTDKQSKHCIELQSRDETKAWYCKRSSRQP